MGQRTPYIIVGAALVISEALNQLRGDMNSSCQLYELDDWDKDILEDSVELLSFQINTFFKRISTFLMEQCRKLEEKKGDFPQEMEKFKLNSFNAVSKHLGEANIHAKESLSGFLSYFGHQDGLQDRGSVPTPTFRELLVQNEISRLAEKIFEAIRSTKDNEAALKKTFPIIQQSLEKFSKHTSTGWLANTIVVVADKQHEIIFTGATRALVTQKDEKGNTIKINVLDDLSKAVNSIRLGTRFSEIINHWTEEFCGHIEVIGNSDTNYDEVHRVNGPKSPWYQKLAAPKTTEIFSWSFDSHNFTPKSPCIRCRFLYNTWVLADGSDDEEKKYDPRDRVWEYKKGKTPPCTYCAESIAAAKVFLLHHGTGVLV